MSSTPGIGRALRNGATPRTRVRRHARLGRLDREQNAQSNEGATIRDNHAACNKVHACGDFSAGWQCGRKEGWRIESGDYFAPFPPFATFPSLVHDSYKDGLAEGVLAGAEALCEH